MDSTTLELSAVTAPVIADIKSSPTNVHHLRRLWSVLTQNLRALPERRDFTLALTFKGVFEDLLRHCMEDDYVSGATLSELVTLLASSFELAARDEVLDQRHDWLSVLVDAGELYRELLQNRPHSSIVTVDGIKFFAALGSDPLLGPAIETEQQKNDLSLRFFPNLDDTLADPSTGKEITHWYCSALDEIRSHDSIGGLCFIEKEYSSVGALTLMGTLCSHSGLPAVIYRPSHLYPEAKLTGGHIAPGAKIVMVYDVTIHGSMLLETHEFLKSRLNATADNAIVLYDFSQSAKQALRQGANIKLTARSTRSKLKSDLIRAHRKLTREEVRPTIENLADKLNTSGKRSESPRVENEAFPGWEEKVQRPDVVLYADASDASRRAFDLLSRHNIHFSVEYSEHNAPRTKFGTLTFRGIERIGRMVSILDDFGKSVSQTARRERTVTSSPSDRIFSEWLRQRLVQYHETARQTMDTIAEVQASSTGQAEDERAD
jgi:orotate phosphoribosyltransferase